MDPVRGHRTDRAIRAKELLDRLQADNLELRERIAVLEAGKEKLEQDNKVLYDCMVKPAWLSHGTSGFSSSSRLAFCQVTTELPGVPLVGLLAECLTLVSAQSPGIQNLPVKDLFPDGFNTMTAIGQEEPNAFPGIDSDPDDSEPWGANLTFPDLMDFVRAIQKGAGNELREKDGWRGPIGLGGGNDRMLLLVAPERRRSPLSFPV